MSDASVARVLIDSPLPQLDRLFDYAIPDELQATALEGVRVKVPLRSAGRVADGVIVERVDAAEFSGTLSSLEAVVSPLRVLTPEVWALARRAADRAAGSAADILRLAIPKRQVRVEKAFLATEAATTRQTISAIAIEGYRAGVIEQELREGGRIAVDAVPHVRVLDSGDTTGAWAHTMAAAAVTTLARGQSAILCVPDYRDQGQLEGALAAVAPHVPVLRLDARQTNAERYSSFLSCLAGPPAIIVGNRSVVYAPAPNLGLIAIWDDGDSLHSEPLAPYVHSRDAALIRQEQQSCALMFLSHTRSTDVERLVTLGWVRAVQPEPRILPTVIPTAQQTPLEPSAARARIPSSAWSAARLALEAGPVLIQVARPGYSPRLVCADCRETARCTRCSGPLLQRASTSTPSCSWCGALAAAWRCSNCDGTRLRSVGSGASRTAEELGRAFPGVKVIVADGERQVLEVGDEPALVIATRGAEPLARGGYRAVLLLDGERMLARESLRVAEDCLRWWSNAIALARGGAPSILVGVGGDLASTLVTWQHSTFARRELADRRPLRFPPAVRVATMTGSVRSVTDSLESLARAGIEFDAGDILGPVELDAQRVRTILRFDFGRGIEIAAALRAEVIRSAAHRRSGAGTRRGSATPDLRVRLDDLEPFLEPGR